MAFDEYRKKLAGKYGKSTTKKEDEEEKSETKNNTSVSDSTSSDRIVPNRDISNATSFKTYKEKLDSKYRKDKVDASGVDKWFSDADSAMKAMDRYNTVNKGKFNREYGGEEGATIKSLLDSSDDVYNYMLSHKDELDDYDKWEKAISEYRSALTKYNTNNYYTKKHYSQWDSEEAYNYSREYAQKKAKAEQMSADEIRDRIKNSSDKSTVAYYDIDGSAVTWDNLLRIKGTEERISKLQNDPVLKYAYRDLVDYENDIKRIENAQSALSARAEGFKPDAEYESDLEYLVKKYGLDANLDLTQPLYALYMQLMDDSYSEVATRKAMLKDAGYDWDEVKAYNKYFADKEEEARLNENYKRVAENYPVLSTAASIVAAPGQILDYVKDLSDMGRNRDAADDSMLGMANVYDNTVTNFTGTMTSNVSQNIDKAVTEATGKEWVGWLASSAYSGATSALQSAATSAVCVTLFGPVVGKAISLGIQGSQAASSQFVSAAKNGNTNGEALALSIAAGVAEGFFEKFSLDHFINMSGGYDVTSLAGVLKGMLKDSGNLIVQGLVESSEELATEIFNTFADDIISGDHSGYYNAVNQYMQSGYTETDAIKAAGEEYIGNLLSSAIGGFFGGISSGAVPTVTNAIGRTANAIEYQNEVVKPRGNAINTLGSRDTLLNLAKETAEEGSPLDKAIAKVEKKATDKNVGNLSIKLSEAVEEQNLSDIASNLEEKGMDSKDAKKTAEFIQRVYDGEMLTEDDKSELYEMGIGEAQIKSAAETIKDSSEQSIERRRSDLFLARLGVNKASTDTNTPKGESAAEGEKLPPESGKMTAIKDGKEVEVQVKKVASIENGEVSLELEGGEVVSASDVNFGGSVGLVYQAAADMASRVGGFNVDTANVFVKGFDPAGNITAAEYVHGFSDAYRYGKLGYPIAELGRGVYTSKLTEKQRTTAYNFGKVFGNEKVAEKQEKITSTGGIISEKIASTGAKNKKGRVHFDGSVSGKSLNEVQRSSLKALGVVAEALGIDVYIFESALGTDGKRQGANGWYDPKDNSVHIDLFAGVSGNDTMLFTAAHELTHHIREKAPQKFKAFADFLLEEYNKGGKSVEELIQAKRAFLEAKGRITSDMTEEQAYDLAYEEVIADSCEAMLVDSNAIETLAKLKTKDKGLWETIRDFISRLVTRIREAYKGLNPDSAEANYVRDMLDAAEKLQALWTEALVEAAENTASERTMFESGISVDSETDSGSLMSVRYLLTDAEQQKVSGLLAERFGVTQKEAKEWLKAETSLASLILNPKYSQYLDYTADENEQAIKSNSDYPQGTVDFSNICLKRRDFTEVMNRVLRNFPNHVFEATDLAKIRTIMQEEGMDVACGICYVEDRRQLDSIVAQGFIDSLAIYREGGRVRPDGKPFNANQLKAFALIEGDAYTPSIYELISLEGRNVLKSKNPAMDEAWVKFNNARGMQSVRLLLNDAEYRRQILKYSPAVVKRKNDLGGLRIYSFSDAEMFHLIDIIQVITDSATVGLSLQGYTKVNEYAKAVKDTGEKLNRSLIPKGDLGYHIENGKVVLDYDTVEGIDINHPDFFDNIDNPNVGNILIGINKTQIRAAMTDKFVDQIIPFHTGQSNEVLGEKGIAAWENYKDYQSERDITTGKKASHQINIYTEVINAAEQEGHPITNKYEFVDKFLEVCKENGLVPRFSEFLNIDENGDYVYTEGYHKFLVDFKTFDQNTGEYLPQMPVKPIFEDEYITQLLRDYVKSQKTKDAAFAKSMPKVLDRITNEIVNRKDVKYSMRGTNKDGIEVYETSEETKKFPYKDRMEVFKSIMADQYRGRTAKFIRNGHPYYALFDSEDVDKNIYGDKKSDTKGWKAKINVGADGNIFELVENSQYNGSKTEAGKKIASHRGVGYWDYFIKTVQIDDKVFDLIANVRKKPDNSFVYSIQLNENKKIEASPSLGSPNGVLNRMLNASDDIISQDSDYVNEKFSDRLTDSFSNRSLLANALETAAQNDIERNRLKQYKEKIELINAEEMKLHELREQIKELSFAKGPRDTAAIRNLQFEANQAANRVNTYDRQLLGLESTKALRNVLEREKKLAYQKAEKRGKEALQKYKEKAAETQRELMGRYQESRKRGVESRNKTAMRHKIKDVVNELNQYLLKGTKDKHVPIELQRAVAEALDAVNMDTVGAEERIANLNTELMKAKTPEAIQEISRKIDRIREMGGNMEAKLSKLKTAYDSIIDSDDPLIANSHDEVISGTIDKVMEFVGDTPLRDMSLGQLEAVYDMYRMVLHSVRQANKAFKAKKSEEISVIANRVMEEIDKLGKQKKLQTKTGKAVSEFDWNNQKPVYAFERIRSDTLTEVFGNVRSGEDAWAVDMTEAKEFREKQEKAHRYKKWDFDKRYNFTSTTGKSFSLSLDQIMSLYAYSKRDQAEDHLKYGGFVFDGLTEVKKKNKVGVTVTYQLKDATAYNLSKETLAEIIGKLTPEQKDFVDAMQDYLSTTMGEKGNEVSLELYGVKLFKEKNYFPLKSAPQYLERAREQAEQTGKIKNSGFTKETKPKARNPIVLASFMDVWANHVNEMSMYHAFTLPLEDFYRVFNYKTPASETLPSEGVIPFIENAHGGAAVRYIDQLLKDLNGGARSDPRESLSKALMAKFKKSAVMASLSVVVQQPTAIVRAMALVDPRDFGIAPITRGVVRAIARPMHKSAWAEVKKYAPVAIIKEMGYFDTGMGVGSVEWLKGEKTFMDKVDDFISSAPSAADELAWISIWNAVKKETAHKHPRLATKSEAFLSLAGERFTEVITKTQVYDSTLSRSANMRSKTAFMNMWTAFMAEPTTSLNMLQDALTNKKGKKHAAQTIAAVYGSVVFNAALVSLVYAMRDDDDDETFAEKYLSRLTTEIIDGINPITYIPFFKDIWSIMQGFDIERADMSLVTDLIDSLSQVVKIVSKDTSNMSEEEISEHQKKVVEALLSISDNIASLTGLPVKNVRRDVNGFINLFKTLSRDMENSTSSLIDNILEDVKASIPVWGWLPGDSKYDKLYDAIVNKDTAYINRLKSGYDDESSYNSAINKAIRENDPRIKLAAKARYEGNVAEYMRIAKEIIAEGNFRQDNVVAAINAEVNRLKPDSESGISSVPLFTIADYYKAIVHGDTYTATVIKDGLVAEKIAKGDTKSDAEKSIASSFVTQTKNAYMDGNISKERATELIDTYGGDNANGSKKTKEWDFEKDTGYAWSGRDNAYRLGVISREELISYIMDVEGDSREDATVEVNVMEFKSEFPEYSSVSSTTIAKFYAPIEGKGYSLEDTGMDIDTYAEYSVKRSKCKGVDEDGDGKTDSGSVKAEVMDVINSLPITYKQKDALYYLNGWAESKINEAPWH